MCVFVFDVYMSCELYLEVHASHCSSAQALEISGSGDLASTSANFANAGAMSP